MTERSPLSEQLLQQLPVVYRERDATGELARWIAVQGDLLQAFHDLLMQLYRDRFPLPERTEDDACQPWVLPYIAELLDVQMVSTDTAGRRAEVGRAVAWRQGKGTLRVIRDIAGQLLGKPVAVTEGWQRTATVARIDRPLLPAAWHGDETDYRVSDSPVFRAGHPGLPAVTVDVRQAARLVVLSADTEGGVPRARMHHPHGVPCFPGTHQDHAPRTVDVRDPDSRHGHVHPRRILVHAVPWDGYFPPRPISVRWERIVEGRVPEERLSITEDEVEIDGETWPRIRYHAHTDTPLRVRGVIRLHQRAVFEFHNLWFDNRVEIGEARVILRRCAARHLLVETADTRRTVLDARGCLFNTVETPRGRMRLEYCTVLRELVAEWLECSDAILVPRPKKDRGDTDIPRGGCIRYSRVEDIPPDERLSDGAESRLRFMPTNSARTPVFLSDRFGEPGCGVLHTAAPEALRAGAEDGGEMGAYHDERLVQRETAAARKVQDFLPLGMRAVFVADETLRCPTPRLRNPTD